MDSITQAVLGAAVGGAYLGPRLGTRALWLGAAVATVPDLDVLVIPLLDPVTQLTAHRTYTHNLLFLALASPLLGYLLGRLQPRAAIGWGRWTLFCALCMVTAVALDLFTAYGVPLLYPFTGYGFAIASISVVDPLYTLPLLVAVGWACWRHRPMRRALAVGLVVANAYLAVSVALKLHAQSVFTAELARQQIDYQRLFSKPTFFNTLLWRVVAEGEDDFWVGFYSPLDADRRVEFQRLPKGEALLRELAGEPAVDAIRLATNGFVQALPAEPGILLRDVRYGSGTDWLPADQDRPFVFSYQLVPAAGGWQVQPLDSRRDAGRESESVRELWRRMLGQR